MNVNILMQVNTTRSREELEIGEVFRLWLNQSLVDSGGNWKRGGPQAGLLALPHGNQKDRGAVNKGGGGAGKETSCKGS